MAVILSALALGCSDEFESSGDGGSVGKSDASVGGSSASGGSGGTSGSGASGGTGGSGDGGASNDAGSDSATGDDAGKAKVAFVTAKKFKGGFFKSLAAADAVCKNAADAESTLKGRTWVAWLSFPASNAIDRLGAGKIWHTTSGKPVFNLVSTTLVKLEPPILDEKAQQLDFSERTWTGTLLEGKLGAHHCGGWSNSTDADGGTLYGLVGNPNASSSNKWTHSDKRLCHTSHHLYCFEL